MENQNFRFYAFISYSRKDIKDAKWIHSSLEKFHIPAKLPRPADAEPIPKPLRCFRDINDLDVMPESFVKGIENALASSKYLVVVCSPNSAKSSADGNHYVDWEIQKFIEVHGIDYARNHILPVIISGEISHNEKETECLPPSLYTLGGDFLHHNFPILDYGEENALTKESKNDFILKILAFLLQVKYSVLNDRYQKAQKKRRQIALGVAALLIVVFAAISVYAGLGWRRADKNLALSYYMQANNLLESNDVSHALAYYNKSLRLDANPVVQDEVYNLITNSSWLVDKAAITEQPEKKAKSFAEKEICEKLNAVAWYDIQKTKEIKNGVLASFSDDERYAVLWQPDDSIRLIEVETGKSIFQDSPESGYTWGNKSLPTGFKCLFAEDNALFVYKQEKTKPSVNNTGFIIKILDTSTMTVTAVKDDVWLNRWTVSPDGQFLVYSARVANNIAELTVYDIQKRQNRWTRRERFPRAKIVFSPDSVHFATTGSIYFADDAAHEAQINNCFHEDEIITATVKGAVDIMQFSNDGRRLAVATSKNELNVFKTRDGLHLVKPRLFSEKEKILGLEFTPDDNNIQVKFQGIEGSKTKEYELRVNSLNFDTIQTSLNAGIIFDTVLLKENYICNLSGNKYGDGLFLEVRNLNDKNDYFITPLNSDIQKLMSQGFMKKSPSGNMLFVGSGKTARKGAEDLVAAYSVDFNNKDYLTYKQQAAFPYPVTDILPVSDRYAIVFCKRTYGDTGKNNLFLLDVLSSGQPAKEYEAGLCLAYALNKKNELYTVNKSADGECSLKKWDAFTLSEKWSVPLGKNVYLSSAILRTDKNGTIYVVFGDKKISVFNKNGKMLREIKSEQRITTIEVSDDGSLLLVGANPQLYGSDIGDVEVRSIKTNMALFKTSYDSENPVSIKKVAFSEDSNILHIAGKYLTKTTSDNVNLGFYDAWDMTTATQIEISFSVEITEIFDFDLLPNGIVLLYTHKGVINKNVFTTNKKILDELVEDSLYQQIGAWTLNQYNVPQAIEFKDELQKFSNLLSDWLTASGDERTINPQSGTTTKDALSAINARRNRELILDIQADNALALNSYCRDVIDSVAEKNWKRDKAINSFADELAIDSAWKNEYAKNFWNIVLKDEEALKLYKFNLDNYLKKVPDSEEPLNKFWQYYRRLGESSKAYSFAELQDMLNYYTSTIAMDSSFEEIKDSIAWFLRCFKKHLLANPSEYASQFSGIFDKIANIVRLHSGGFDFYLQCIDFICDGVSDSTKILLRLEQEKQAVEMMGHL